MSDRSSVSSSAASCEFQAANERPSFFRRCTVLCDGAVVKPRPMVAAATAAEAVVVAELVAAEANKPLVLGVARNVGSKSKLWLIDVRRRDKTLHRSTTRFTSNTQYQQHGILLA
jgi:hypothetical protein